MEQIGIRELKTHLSRHLKRVRAGTRLLVTDRGQTIAAIGPVEPRPEGPELEWAQRMVVAGRLQWTGGKPRGSARPVSTAGSSISDAVLEDRR